MLTHLRWRNVTVAGVTFEIGVAPLYSVLPHSGEAVIREGANEHHKRGGNVYRLRLKLYNCFQTLVFQLDIYRHYDIL